MAALSLDLRERIVAACDEQDATQAQVAKRFRVSLGMVKKLLGQRRRTGTIAPLYARCGRKPRWTTHARQRQLQALLAKTPDLTLKEMRATLGWTCSLQAIQCVLVKLELTYKKRRSAPPSRTGRTWRGRAVSGAAAKAGSIPPG